MLLFLFFFFFNDTATTEIYTLSLHDALPICGHRRAVPARSGLAYRDGCPPSGHEGIRRRRAPSRARRSEEHTSELQSRLHLVCRLLLEKKKKQYYKTKHKLNSILCRTSPHPT